LPEGATALMILRRVNVERWEVVGEAYIHGIMQGEVWKTLKEEDFLDIRVV
jgi:hypothetical protein